MAGVFGAGMNKVWAASLHLRHCAAIRRLCWTLVPQKEDAIGTDSKERRSALKLASCGEDHLVRVCNVKGL